MSFRMDTRGFERQMDKLAQLSTRSAEEIVTLNSQQIIRSIAYNSPKRSGNMNRGWLPAWNALGAKGTPNTHSRQNPNTRTRKYVAEGAYIDGRRQKPAFFEFENGSHAVINGKRVNYPFIVNARKKFMAKAEAEVAQRFDRMLAKKMREVMK